MSVECMEFRSYSSGSLVGFATLYVPKWGVVVKDISVFNKEGNRWISFPSREFVSKEGEKAYNPYIKFRSKDHHEAFNLLAIKAIDDYALRQTETSVHGGNPPEDGCPF